jgi:hypothetical protein
MRTKSLVLAIIAASVSGVGACDGGTPLADMVDKQLDFDNLDDDFFSVSLFAKGCPLLVPGTVQATLNGHAMTVDPGHHGSGFGEAPCYQPTFELSPLPPGLGAQLTFVIADASETLRAVIGGFHPDLPVLEAQPAQPSTVHRGDVVSISFTAAAEPPDDVQASFSEDGTPAGPPPCFYNDDAAATIATGEVDLAVPTTLCYSPAWLRLCLGYASLPHLEACENASCSYEPTEIQVCAEYPVTIDG